MKPTYDRKGYLYRNAKWTNLIVCSMNAISWNHGKSVFYLNYIFPSENGIKWLQKGRMTWALNEQELIGLRQSGPRWPILAAHPWYNPLAKVHWGDWLLWDISHLLHPMEIRFAPKMGLLDENQKIYTSGIWVREKCFLFKSFHLWTPNKMYPELYSFQLAATLLQCNAMQHH